MPTEPLVSVIIPALHAEATLLRGLRARTGPSSQAIVASKDGGHDLAVLVRAGIRHTMTENGRAPRVDAGLARLVEEPPRVA